MQATLTSSKSLKRTSTNSRPGEDGSQAAHTTQKAPNDIAREQFYGAEAVQASNRGMVVFSYASAQSIKEARLEALQHKLQERLKAHHAPPVDPYQGLETHTTGVEDVAAPTSLATAGSQLPGAGVGQYSTLVVPPQIGNMGDEKASTAKLVSKGEVQNYQRSTVVTKPKAVPVQYALPGQLSAAVTSKDGKASPAVTPRSPRAESAQQPPVRDQAAGSSPGAAASATTAAQGNSRAINRAAHSTKQAVPPSHAMLDTLKASIPTTFLAVPVSSSLVPAKGLGTTSQVIGAVRGTLGPSVMQPLQSHNPATVAGRMLASGEETATQDAAGNEVRTSYQGGVDLRQGNEAGNRTAVPLVKVQVEDLIGQYKQQAAKQLLAQAGLSRAPSFHGARSNHTQRAGHGPAAGELKAALQVAGLQSNGPLTKTAAGSRSKKAANEVAKKALESASDVALRSLMQAMNPAEGDDSLGIRGFGATDIFEPVLASDGQPDGDGAGGDQPEPAAQQLRRATSTASSNLTIPPATVAAAVGQKVSQVIQSQNLMHQQQGMAVGQPPLNSGTGSNANAVAVSGSQQAVQEGALGQRSSSRLVSSPSLPVHIDSVMRSSAGSSSVRSHPTAVSADPTQPTFAVQPAVSVTAAIPSPAATAPTSHARPLTAGVSRHAAWPALEQQQQQQLPSPRWSAAPQSPAAAYTASPFSTEHQCSHTSAPAVLQSYHRSAAAMPTSGPSRISGAGCGPAHEAPPGWSCRQQPQLVHNMHSTRMYGWTQDGPRHRPRPHTATAGGRVNVAVDGSLDHGSQPGAVPGSFSFTITGCGYQQEVRRQKGEEDRASPRLASSAVAQQQPAVFTRKTTSRSRNGSLAWSSLTDDSADNITSCQAGASPNLSTSLHPPPLPAPVLTPHPTVASSTPAPAMPTRPSSASPYLHTTPSLTQLAEAELAKSRQNLHYRVLEHQAKQLGLDSPRQLLDSHTFSCGAHPNSITITPAAMKHMQLQSQSSRPMGVQATQASTATRSSSVGAGAPAAYTQPVVRSLSATDAHAALGGSSGLQVSTRSPSSPRPASAFITPSGRQRPHSALPLNSSNALVRRTRPPSAGSWGGGEPFLANVVANVNERKQSEGLYRSSTNVLEDMPGVCRATVSGFFQPPLAAAQVTAAML